MSASEMLITFTKVVVALLKYIIRMISRELTNELVARGNIRRKNEVD